MRIFDSYIDTYEKRKYLFLILIITCCLIFSIMHILLGIYLLPIQNYDDVLSLVDKWIIQQSYFGRNALELLNIQVLNKMDYLFQLFRLKLFEWIFFIGNCLCLFTSMKRYGCFNLLIFVIVYLFIIFMFLVALRSGSLYEIMNYVRMIGIGMILAYSISFIVQIRELIIGIRKYIESLKVKVVIVDEMGY